MRVLRRSPELAATAVAVLLLSIGAGLLASAPALAKGGKEAPKPPEWTEEEGRTVLHVFSPSPLKAYLAVPSDLPEGTKAELLVILHGHGGTATGMLGYGTQIAQPRKAFVLACEGSGDVQTPQGPGHAWGGDADVGGILACLDATLAKHPIDPKRVVVMGHSAGGTMSLLTYAKRPAAFAGVYTTAAPMTPSSAQKGARVVVCLGTKDPNFQGFPAAVTAAEKTVVGRVMAVTDLAHDLPNATYSAEALAWILDSKAPSETLHLPFEPGAEALAPPDTPGAKAKGKQFRHALVFEAGGREAPKDALAKAAAKAKAQEWSAAWKKLPAGADLGEAMGKVSEDPLSKDLRGVVSGAVLARYGGPLVAAMSKLRGGEVSAPLEGDAGFHIVTRDP